MSKKLTYVELDAERARLAKSERLLGIALNLTLHGKPDATEQVSHEGDQWKLQLYGARRADAGIVVETFYHPGQSPHSAVHYLDDLTRIPARLSDGGMKYTEALSRLRSARDRIVYESERPGQALQAAPESSAQNAERRYSIRHEDGSMLAEGLTIGQVEQWWKGSDASGKTNEDRYEGLRTEGNVVLVTVAREWWAEDGRDEDDCEQSPAEDLGR
jgi:hypothetical protein